MGIYSSLKQTAQRKVVKKIILSLGDTSNESLYKIAGLFNNLLPGKNQNKAALEGIKRLIKENHPAVGLIRGIIKDIDPNCRDKFIENFIVNGLLLNQEKVRMTKEAGSSAPFAVLISPTMRCNLECIGCYAKDYSRKDDLEIDIFDKAVSEGEEIGVALFIILGGEPFVAKDKIYEIAKKHNKAYFQVYTNGSLINEKVAEELKDIGNILPILSIEGFEKETDQRRGKGTYKKVMETMDILKKFNVPFGYSVVVTSKNADIITSDRFIDLMVEKGAYIGWHFLYMPIGATPDLSLMPTPEQRKMLRDRWIGVRNSKPLFIVDFWNDAPSVGGCIAGRMYVHINSSGDVEPCIFTHFSVDNIKNKSLFEIMKSDFFRELRSREPFDENLYMPCMWIDRPEIGREICIRHKTHPTHPGAETILYDKKIIRGLEKYSKKMRKIFDPLWEEEKKKINSKIC